eukprot:1152615-Pelagomonas_calceolata.AAC.4
MGKHTNITWHGSSPMQAHNVKVEIPWTRGSSYDKAEEFEAVATTKLRSLRLQLQQNRGASSGSYNKA